MASVAWSHSAQILKFFAKHLSKKETKKNCHPFNISIFSLAKFEFENPPKYEISMFPANLAFE